MSYVDAWYNRDQDLINIVERDEKGNRHYREYPQDTRSITKTAEASIPAYSVNLSLEFPQRMSRSSARNWQFTAIKNYMKVISTPSIAVWKTTI